MLNNKNAFLLICTSLFLTSCAKQKREQFPHLRPLTSYINYQETKDNITLRVKQLSQDDCKTLFGDRARLLYKKKRRRQPIYPIQLSITNQTEHTISLNPDNISLKLTPYRDVVRRLEHNAFLQVIGGLAIGFISAALIVAGGFFALTSGGIFTALFGSLGATLSAPLFIVAASAVVVTPFFVVIGPPVISTVRGVESYHKNKIIKCSLQDTALNDGLRIAKGQTIDTLIFVGKKQYQDEFTVQFTDPKNNIELPIFHVDLESTF